MKPAQKPGRSAFRKVKCRRQLGFDHRPAAITFAEMQTPRQLTAGPYDLRRGGTGLRSVRPPDTV
jgi:hypothetical protein